MNEHPKNNTSACATATADRQEKTPVTENARGMVIAEIYAKIHLCLGNSALPRLAFEQRQLWRACAELWKKQLYQLISESLIGRQITITQDEGRWLATHWDGNVAHNVVLEAIHYGDALELAYKEFHSASAKAPASAKASADRSTFAKKAPSAKAVSRRAE